MTNQDVLGAEFYLSLRFVFRHLQSRIRLEGPMYFGPFGDESEAKQTLKEIIAVVRDVPVQQVNDVPRFVAGKYVVGAERTARLTVIESRRGIACLTPSQVADLKSRLQRIIPVSNGQWKEYISHIPAYLIERVRGEYRQPPNGE